jgi:CHAT domain-containing protein
VEALPPGTVLLEYFIARGRVLLFVVAPDQSPRVHDAGSVREVLDAMERLRFQVDRALASPHWSPDRLARSRESAAAELDRLGSMLLAPARESLLTATCCITVPHGALHAAPLHALTLDGRPLIERCEVYTSPSASVLRSLSRRPPPDPEGPVVVVGCGDERAPDIEDEARAVGRLLHSPTVLIGLEATREAVVGALSRAAAAHLACHGTFAPENPLASGLRLADGWLTARDAQGIRMPSTLLVLSGCETGRVSAESHEEITGLLRGFLAAGAKAVVATLWPVHDRTAGELIGEMHNSWYCERGGAAFGRAYRGAMVSAIQRELHPAHWASFILVGAP